MKFRRIICVLLAVMTVATCAAVAGTAVASGAAIDAAPSSAYQDMLQKSSADDYGLASSVNEGTILQAWNWSFKNVEDNLELLASQGFTTIQVSPPNEIKKGTKGAKVLQSDNQNGWWMFYQPAGFQLNESTDNALGTKAEFVSMCEKAHTYGIKIIVDAVINHMGTKDGDDYNTSSDPMTHVTPKAQTFEPEIYNNKLFHTPWAQMTYKEDPSQFSQYDSTYDLTRNCTSGLPDLKTEDARVQNAIYEYMDELITAGADGFRFDAAKHIETPDDISGLRSDFWTNTLTKVRNAHKESEVYAYGEILNTCGVRRPYSMYTKLFDVTDSGSYWSIKDAATNGGGNATPYYPNSNFTSENTILWDESHDTYMDGATTGLTVVQRGKIWALVAGRSTISTVYFARPDDSTSTGACYNITLGEARKTAWSNATTKAINQFHNYFVGESEYCTANSNGTAYIERGTTGCILVRLGNSTTANVSVANHKLKAGTYTDAITGAKFNVTGSVISGKIGNTGVACIYQDSVTPTQPPTQRPTTPPETFTYKIGDADLDNTISIIDATTIQKKLASIITISEKQQRAADADEDGTLSVIDATMIQKFLASIKTTARVGTEVTIEIGPGPEPTVTPQPTDDPYYPTEDPNPPQPGVPTKEGCYTVVFSNNYAWGGTIHLYSWDAGGEMEWPGDPMEYYQVNDYGEVQYVGFVPMDHSHFIINNNNGSQTVDLDISGNTGVYLTGDPVDGVYNASFFDI